MRPAQQVQTMHTCISVVVMTQAVNLLIDAVSKRKLQAWSCSTAAFDASRSSNFLFMRLAEQTAAVQMCMCYVCCWLLQAPRHWMHLNTLFNNHTM
jgi:hypothetical protein